MGDLSDFRVGQTVELQDGRIATVQFVGSAHFAAGDWIGVDLEDATGKNDGSVQGERYFDCEAGHGMFVRPAAAIVTAEPAPKPVRKPDGKANGTPVRTRPQNAVASGLKRQSLMDPTAARRQSINANSPTPNSRGLRPPSKSPTKQLATSVSSGNATPRTSTPPTTVKPSPTLSKSRASISARPSMGPPAVPSTKARTSRQSIAGTLNGAPKPSGPASLSTARAPSNRLSPRSGVTKRVSSLSGGSQGSTGSGQPSSAGSQDLEVLSPHSSDVPDYQARNMLSPPSSHAPIASLAIDSTKAASSRAKVSPKTAQTAPPSSTAASREIEDLKTKLRMMEKKRMEDREKLKALEKIQGDRDKFEGIIQKLQAKYQPQQQEIVDLRKQLKDAEAKAEEVEVLQAEHDSVLEMATLDREMAEEAAEALKTELDALRQNHEEVQLEVEILREENQELGKEMSPEEKTSQGWIQMERSNERLREALMRLRDMTQQQESESRQQIKELQRDLQALGTVKEQFDDKKESLTQAEAVIDDLRQQLDAALGAEEMIEELAEKNMALSEQIDDLRLTIEDLESLKELNDELEINHIETEKQMQEEIDYKESVLVDQTRKSALQDETIEDLEYTVARFRELVTNMQSDLEDMRASRQITETEANDLTSRSRAMMDLNMRLQVSASKAQVKAIDLELRRMDAQESAEHLSIVQLFLPEGFNNNRDSVLALLRFKRIGFKASLMHGFIKERVQNQAPAGHEDSVFACCDILDKVTWVSTMCDRFVSFIHTCSLEAFGRLEGALYDLEPVERAFNGWIDGLKRDELKEEQCASELQRSIALMTHLAEVHINEGLERYADDIYMRGLIMQSQLENAAAALSHVKTMAQTKLAQPGDDGDEDHQEASEFMQRADSLISQIRSAKVITSKAIHQLSELRSRSLTLNPSTLHIFEATQALTSSLASATRTSGLSLFALLNEEGRTTPFTYSEITRAIDNGDSTPFSNLASSMQTTTSQVQALNSLTTTLSQTIEFTSQKPPPPWLTLAQNLRAASTHSASHESEVGRLKDELSEKNTTLALQEKVVEEMGVKVEVLEKRATEAGGRRERVRELESAVERSNATEKELTTKLHRLEEDLKTFQTERETWTKTTGPSPSAHPGAINISTSGPEGATTASSPTPRELSALKSEIHALRAAIRHLRASNHLLLYPPSPLSHDSSWLHHPLIPAPSAAEVTQKALQAEGKDALNSLLVLATKSGNGVVRLRDRNVGAEDGSGGKGRLGWRPVRETSRWTVERQREEWEAWREWVRDVGVRSRVVGRDRERRSIVGRKRGGEAGVLAQVQVRLPGWDDVGKGGKGGREVRIATAGEWAGFVGELGLGAVGEGEGWVE